jgi:putative membrane protein
MMGYYGEGFGLMWLWGLLLLVGIAVLVLLAVRIFTGGVSRGPGPGPGPVGPYSGKSQARLILEERFARGELTAEQYRENLKVLGEEP